MCSCKRQCSLRRCWLEVVRLREAFRSSLGDGLRERRPCGKPVCGLIRSLTKYAFLRSLGSDQFILKNVCVHRREPWWLIASSPAGSFSPTSVYVGQGHRSRSLPVIKWAFPLCRATVVLQRSGYRGISLCGYGKVLDCGWHLQQHCGAEVLAGLVFPFCVNDAPSQSECLHLTGADAAIDPLL